MNGWAQAVCTLGGIGRLRPAPGTWASLAAVLAGAVIHRIGQFPLLALATVAAAWIGMTAIRRYTAGMADPDRAEIVVDELVGQWLTLGFGSAGFFVMQHGMGVATDIRWLPWPGPVVAFLAFRIFDIRKPWLVGRADRRKDAGGVMMDDVWAGLFGGLLLVVLAGLSHGLMK